MKIAAISDVHGKWNKLEIPEVDVLISGGDYSFRGEKHLVKDFHKWLSKQPAKHVISVQGNHETFHDVVPPNRAGRCELSFAMAKQIAEEQCPGVHFIGDHGTVVIDGVKIHGSAITPWFLDWAWNVERGEAIATEWAKIPDDTEILITHGPMKGILDYFPEYGIMKSVGCEELYKRMLRLEKMKLHICGHIHYSHGHHNFTGKKFYNVSICDEQYVPTNPVTVIEY